MIIGIVGGTAGLGFSIALRLAMAGYEVAIGSRSEEKARAA
ncbi:MAG: NAD(P)-binding domain-containing protein, partial [Nitrososphaerota archaeon]